MSPYPVVAGGQGLGLRVEGLYRLVHRHLQPAVADVGLVLAPGRLVEAVIEVRGYIYARRTPGRHVHVVQILGTGR